MHRPPAPSLALSPPPVVGRVWVAFSGGLDSTVLLHRLTQEGTLRAGGLHAIHVHHGLQPDADAWATHCAALCRTLDVPLQVHRVHVDMTRGEGVEAAARRARHAVFTEVMQAGDIIALAHHRDDQAETFLLRALRASGPEGLAAMRAWRPFGTGWLWRPLLDSPRSDLEAYARAASLSWIEDPSNAGTAFDRNVLRHQVLPLLRQRWPQVHAAFARSAALSAEANDLLEKQDRDLLASAATADPAALHVAPLRDAGAAARARALRRWIDGLALPPLPAEGVARIDAELLDARPDAQAEFAWHGAIVRRWRDLLHAERLRPALPEGWQADWSGAETLPLPDGGWLSLEGDGAPFDMPVRVTGRRGGERIALPARSHRHALKDVLQSLGIPPWERRQLPLLWQDDVLWAAGDLVLSAACDAWLRAAGRRLVWHRG
ncbi:tRNA lysidine(34) synthetase TilS [Pseudoxanthomonas sp. PXM01]|uniref:tRNA lysidine(34) synthetase TilS n=1 Tax=Pseudoxanthomonas sp. PXM01 TaxID=2769295 RepID=UPI001784CD7A|nr:tRNA lysidine(34) synthetase TilS [Pseudoxanthomonas sp. PXM01]MBD9468469.1 tRNA lysidine(34) synthetase TilS [Pseudoxanthomonas sp. PXM01]